MNQPLPEPAREPQPAEAAPPGQNAARSPLAAPAPPPAVLNAAPPHSRETVPSWGPPWWLRPADQATLAWLVGGALAALALGWWWVGRQGVPWIELEQLPPRSVAFQVDLNSADWPELSLLPGIGETLARRIVERRQVHGPYRQLDDLLEVDGLGDKTLEKIRPFLVVGDPATAPLTTPAPAAAAD